MSRRAPATGRPALALAAVLACGPDEPPRAPAAPPAPEPPPVFHLVARRDGDLELQRLGAAPWLVGGGALTRLDRQGLRTVPRSLPPELGPDAPQWFRLTHGGPGPDSAWLIVEALTRRVDAPARLFRRAAGRWSRVDPVEAEPGWRYLAVFTWREGQVLGLRVGRARFPEPADMTEGTAPPFVPLQGFDLLGDPVVPAWPEVAGGLFPATAAAAPDGALFLLAHRGDPELGRVAVQRWDPARPDRPGGVVDDLPGRALAAHLVVAAADRAFVAGARREREAAWLARFDGTTWSEEPVPEGIRFRALALAGDGALWAVTDLDQLERDAATRLSRRRPGGPWQAVALPDLPLAAGADWGYGPTGHPRRCGPAGAGVWPVRPQQLAIDPAGRPWLTGVLDRAVGCAPAGIHVLLGPDPLGAPLELPGDRRRGADHEFAPTSAGGCPRGAPPLAVLLALSEQTPADAAVPELEALAREHPDLLADLRGLHELEHAGERLVGAFVDPALPPERLAALLAAFDRVAPGRPHGLTCLRPLIRRAFDPGTGRPEP